MSVLVSSPLTVCSLFEIYISMFDYFPFRFIIISVFQEDNISGLTTSLPYGPPMNTDIDYYQTFILFVIYAM